MCRVLSLALTAMVLSDVHFPAACLEAWARLDVLVLPDSRPCFIEHLVTISLPAYATLRNTRTVAFGGLGQCKRWAGAHRIARAANGLLDAPSPPGLGSTGSCGRRGIVPL
jgi:hypothetical protein